MAKPIPRPNGQKIPSSITYIDGAGGKTNYFSVRQISDILDAPVAWNSKTDSVDFLPLGPDKVTAGDLEAIIKETPRTPTFGTVCGPFTEIDPSTLSKPTVVDAVYDGMHIDALRIKEPLHINIILWFQEHDS